MTTVTNDGMLVLADLLGVQTLPGVLGLGPRQDRAEDWLAARELAETELRQAGLVDDYDDVRRELAEAVQILARPERELVARSRDATGERRMSLAREGTRHAVATRAGEQLRVRTVWADDTGAALARPLLDMLGPCPAAEITAFSAPAEDLRPRLDAATDAAAFAQVARTYGVDDDEAMNFGLAMAGCLVRTEVVAYVHADGIATRSSGAVAIYDTGRGRIVASPGTSADLAVWSTFTPGSDHRVAEAIAALADTLPGGRWMP
ncbi:ESX secretion-associated protein EspG [Nocardia farcinica]|uniref:ESX secretion-associated protein EspG n=1 Tax=Nocardia farcinica TaxID=37329 RepID=UPI00245835CA|nr:ESX secretion-associated protein EspG [Nocardia farcinica]